VVYCPDLPPVPGGVSDHTAALARSLGARFAEVNVVGRRGDPSLLAPIPCRVGVSPASLPSAIAAAGARALILQYVPFLFARSGLAPALVGALGRLRRAGVRVGVLVHEPFVPFTRLPWLVTGWPMRWQLRAVVRRADAVWSPVPAFLAYARRAARPATRLGVVPVGATVPVAPADGGAREEVRRRLGLTADEVVIGVFSPGAAAAASDWVNGAVAALAEEPRVRWVRFGNGSGGATPRAAEAARVLDLGRLEPAEVGRIHRALDLAVAPFADGLTLRRTSAMAALAHGVPLVSSRGPLFDPSLADAAVCAPTAELFVAAVRALVADPGRRAALGAAGRRFYDAAGSTAVLAARISEDLALS
jgi:glycosyltransferase involved in cell wall biosynthesis